MDEATFAALIVGTDKHYDVNARQVSNGFAIAGNVRYVDPTNGNVKVAQSFEAVATDAAGAATALATFLSTGKFA